MLSTESGQFVCTMKRENSDICKVCDEWWVVYLCKIDQRFKIQLMITISNGRSVLTVLWWELYRILKLDKGQCGKMQDAIFGEVFNLFYLVCFFNHLSPGSTQNAVTHNAA